MAMEVKPVPISDLLTVEHRLKIMEEMDNFPCLLHKAVSPSGGLRKQRSSKEIE
jgi:hypothetical protein